MQTQWYKSNLYCSKEIKDFLLKLAYGQIEACKAQKIASELYIRSVVNKLIQKDEVNMFFNTPIEGWDNDPCKICESKNNYEQLKEDYAELKQECENLKAEEKYLKQCCEKAGKELAKHSFDYDGKEKNLVVQAMELNEKYEKLEKALEEIEQEREELKEEISKLQLNEYHYKNELKKYKKGIHKYRNLLKYEINNLRLSRREFLKMVGRYPKFEKDNIKLALDTFNRKLELIDNPSRYCKALEEIELTIKNLEKDDIITFPDFTLQENATMIMNQCNQGYRDIFDIINKVKGEGK